jgi:hypothetical protein
MTMNLTLSEPKLALLPACTEGRWDVCEDRCRIIEHLQKTHIHLLLWPYLEGQRKRLALRAELHF